MGLGNWQKSPAALCSLHSAFRKYRPFRGGPKEATSGSHPGAWVVATTTEFPVCLAVVDSWRRGCSRSCCSCSGVWRLWLGRARRAMEGGEQRSAPAVRGGAGRAGPRCRAPGALTGCACRQRHGAGTPAAVAEEERCTVERRADLSYAEFVQQYVRRPILATPLTPENPSRSSRSSVNLNRCCHALVCPAGHMCPELPRPPPCHQE